MATTPKKSYPILEEFLEIQNLPLQPTYSTRDLATLFKVSMKTIQNRIASGRLVPRDIPGRAKFLAQDIEEFLMTSRRLAS